MTRRKKKEPLREAFDDPKTDLYMYDTYQEPYNEDTYNDVIFGEENGFGVYTGEEDADAYDLPPEERNLRRIGRFKVAAGLFDFSSLIIGLVVALMMLLLILSLINWVVTDMSRLLSFMAD